MSKNTQISELINYISVDGSGNVVLTGNLILPGSAQAATQTYVNTAISNLVNAAPTALDTLAELSTALNNDASFATTVTNSIASKLALSGGTLTGALNGTSATFTGNVRSGGLVGAVNLFNLYKSDNTTLGGQLAYDSSINQLYLWNDISSGYFSIYTNGGERLKIESNGTTTLSSKTIFNSSVGIGTSSPNKALEILSISDQLRLSYNASTYTDLRSDSAGGLLIKAGGGYIIQYINGSEKTRLTSDGYFGIGTGSPVRTLHVMGQAAFDMSTAGVVIQDSAGVAQIVSYKQTGSTYSDLHLRGSVLGIAINGSNGTVGINTASPDTLYNLTTVRFVGSSGNIKVIGDTSVTGSPAIIFYNAANSTSATLSWNGNFNMNGNLVWHAGNDGNGSGLDADLLDGRNGSAYAQINSGDVTFQGGVTYTGWYKLARSNQNAGGYGPRGAFKITVAATGNYLSPAQDIIFGYKDWVNTLHFSRVESYLGTSFSNYRITTDSDYTYLEGYLSGFWVAGDQAIAIYCESNGHNGLQWFPLTGYATSGLSSPSTSASIGKNNSATTFASLYSAYSEVKVTADGNDFFVGRYSGGSAKLFRVFQSGADGYLEMRTGANDIVTRLSGYSGAPTYFLSNVGIGTNDPTHRLDVVGGSGTTPVASFTSGGNSWSEGIYINPSTANGYAGIYYPIAADSQADGMWFTGRITSTDSNFPNGFGFARKGLTGGGIPGWGGNAMNIKQDGTVYFGFDVRHGQNYKGLTFVQLTSCIGWSTSITGNTQTTISTTGLGLPSGVKAISVVGWYHVRNYGAAQGQGDHATAWFGISNDQTPYPWAGTNGGYPYDSNTFTRADYGSFVMEHDGDASIATGSSGGPHYYGSWHNGIINVNANGTIYCNLGSGYSGGTHYFALYIQGYWI